ncbi:MAG: hypothetical protein K6U89_20160 [Chloroflexi bacterium]|nr:hypothetical protein [Chloroflexota bacterium]
MTLIDASTRTVKETRPLNAQVRWLSNEQTYWDGQYVWTYDFPNNRLQAIAIDPKEIGVKRTIADIGTGPGHSLMVFPDKRKAAVNVAGDNALAFLDLPSGQVEKTVPTGAFPCDLHLSPDGRWGYIPERDQDTVSKFDMQTGAVVKTVSFPPNSRPYMLRVSRDGKEVWVQTANANTNVVLNAEDLSVLATEPAGRGPVTNAWSIDNRYSFITNSNDTVLNIFDAKTYKEIKRLTIGMGGSNIGFTRDGTTAFISVSQANSVAVIDMARLEVAGQLRAGTQPFGLIIL